MDDHMIALDREQSITLIELLAMIANHAELHGVHCIAKTVGMLAVRLILDIEDEDESRMLAEHMLAFADRDAEEQRDLWEQSGH